jgi:hypothetical protein
LSSQTELEAVEGRGSNNGNNPNDEETSSVTFNMEDEACEAVKVAELYAGQNTYVGTVSVQSDGSFYTVTYTAIEGYCFSEIHFESTNVNDGFPLKSGNPNPGGMDYKRDDLGCESSWTFQVADQGPYLAAHAVVNCITRTTEEILAEIPSSLTLVVDRRRDIPGSDQDFYWDITLNDFPFNSEYGAYCVDPNTSLGAGTYANTAVYLATDWESLPAGRFTNPQNFPAVNWLLNEDIIGNGYTYGDLQVAIWTLVSEGICCEDIIGPYDQAKVDELVTKALEFGLDFVPDCDDFMGVILVPESSVKQPIIFKFKLDCGESCDETAWGRNSADSNEECGNLPGANWATYFKYDIDN